jgi:DNA repair exonuclease SbcCD nuclease subunit
MKLVHLSDTHLGHLGQGRQPQAVEDPFQPGARTTQRAADILAAFRQAVDLIVDEIVPDLVIHSGDLFDSARPQAGVIHAAMAEFNRIAAADIPCVIIEGHHSFPRERAMGHALRLLEYVRGVQVVFDEYRDVRVAGLPLVIHSLPHDALQGGRAPQRDCIDPKMLNVLVAHGIADGSPFYQMGRVAPPLLLGECVGWYDYIALGHFHRFCQANLRRRAFYAGAPSMITWRDFAPGHRFGVNVVELDGNEPLVTPIELPGRPMHAYGLDSASELSANEIMEFLDRQVRASPARDAYCQCRVVGVGPLARKDLDLRAVEALFAGHAGLNLVIASQELPLATALRNRREGGSPEERFRGLANVYSDDLRDEVLRLGLELLEQAAGAVSEADGS